VITTSGVDFGTDCAPDEYRTIDPMTLLRRWLPPQDSPPPLMALATCAEDGYPRVRHVLLSEADDRAVYFHTDSRTAKVAELTARPRAAVALAWPTYGRQVVAHGDVHLAPADELLRVFSRRPRYLQILAWLNDTGMAALPESERQRRWAEFDATNTSLQAPPTWTGFGVVLHEVTFWRAATQGPSQRVRFTRDGGSWHSEVLPG
jgi:pyridoxamine 5'-phosphate oxidase